MFQPWTTSLEGTCKAELNLTYLFESGSSDSGDFSWNCDCVHGAEVVISVLYHKTVVGRHVGSTIIGFRCDLLCLCPA